MSIGSVLEIAGLRHLAGQAAARFGQAFSYSPSLDDLLRPAIAAAKDHSPSSAADCNTQDGQPVVFGADHWSPQLSGFSYGSML